MDSSLNLPPLEIAALLRAHGLKPRKGLGQNFLMDPVALQRIVTAAEIQPDDVVLEVGPGLGSLTRHLAQTARKVVAVEIDSALFPILAETLEPWKTIELVQGDIMQLNPAELVKQQGYLVVANIPYYITSALIRRLLEADVKPARIVLTVQKEVAERITAGPGEMSLLALSVQVYGQPRIAARIPAGAFYPPPKVDSAVVRVDLYPQPRIAPERLEAFFTLIKAGFSQKRKTLRNALSGGLGWSRVQVEDLLAETGIDPMRRAETLSLDEWSRVVASYSSS